MAHNTKMMKMYRSDMENDMDEKKLDNAREEAQAQADAQSDADSKYLYDALQETRAELTAEKMHSKSLKNALVAMQARNHELQAEMDDIQAQRCGWCKQEDEVTP